MAAGRFHSIYFATPSALRRVKRAAKLRGVSVNRMMVDAVEDAAERIIAKNKKRETAKAA